MGYIIIIILAVLLIIAYNGKSSLKKENEFLKRQIKDLKAKLYEEGFDEYAPEKKVVPDVNQVQKTENTVSVSAPQYSSLYRNNSANQSVPTPAPTPAPAPVKTVAEKIPEEKPVIKTEAVVPEKKTSAISIILILGALFLCLSGFIFAAATWGVLNTFFKTVVLLSFSAFFFAMHSFTERKLKLKQTGRVFYIIGSIFLPAAFVAAGILDVFGEYLSFSGDGCLLMMAITTFSLCIPFFKGGYDYKNKVLASVSHYSFSLTVFLMLLHFIPRADVAILANAVYSFAVIITEPMIRKLYDRIFGEGNVFSEIYSYFSVISVTILSLLSLFVFIGETINVVTLFAFAVYGVSFLMKTVSEKSGLFSASFFAIFITTSLFSGFEPDSFSAIIFVITLTAVIYGVLSFMGILPEGLEKIFRYFGIVIASLAGFLVSIDFLISIAEENPTTLSSVVSSFLITAELIILSVRYRTNALKALSFVSFILSVTGFILLFGLGLIGNIVISFIIVLAYYFLISITPLKNVLKSAPANDIIFGIFALIYSFISSTNITEIKFVSIGILIVSAVSMVICNRGKTAEIFCPIFTLQMALPLFALFNFSFDIENANLAMSVVMALFCVIASVLLFIPKAKNYAVSYGYSLLAVIPIFLLSCIITESADFIPLIFVIGYTTLFFIRKSLPSGRYGDINLISGAILLASFVMGFNLLLDLSFVFCFPAIVMLLMFAFAFLSTIYKAFPNVTRPIQTFLWWALPIISFCLMISGCVADELSLVIFGTLLTICAGVISVFGKNTMNLIAPVFMLSVSVAVLCDTYAVLIPLIMFVIAGRILFREQLFDGVYSDIFSVGAFVPAIAYFIKKPDDLGVWLGVLILSFVTLNLIRKGHDSFANNMCISVAGLCIFPMVWLLPFFEVPELITVQFNLLPVLFYCILIKFIWKDYPVVTDTFSFVSAIISLVILFIDSFISAESFDAVFIGTVLFIMLFVSFIIKKKRWFVLSVSSMVISGILLSFGQKDSIAWLIYLAIAGVALIAMGLANEMKKQQEKTGEETKLSRFMSDWTW